jgi:hypothetical protein
MRKQTALPRRAKLPPILEIDEDGLPVNEREFMSPTRWSSDEDATGIALGEWPTEFDD